MRTVGGQRLGISLSTVVRARICVLVYYVGLYSGGSDSSGIFGLQVLINRPDIRQSVGYRIASGNYSDYT